MTSVETVFSALQEHFSEVNISPSQFTFSRRSNPPPVRGPLILLSPNDVADDVFTIPFAHSSLLSPSMLKLFVESALQNENETGDSSPPVAPVVDGGAPAGDGKQDQSAAASLSLTVMDFNASVLAVIASYVNYFAATSAREASRTSVPAEIATPFPPHNYKSKSTFNNFEISLLQLFDNDIQLTVGVLNATNYLALRSLLYLAGLSMSMRFRHKKPEAIKALFSGVTLPVVPAK
jgi:hypothetical protein